MVGTSSMEVGVRAETEDLLTGEVRHTVSAYLTVVALDANGRPRRVPGLILESEEEKRRNREALRRREMRLAERKRESESQREPTGCR
jgi:acyl-CoA hydrolase